MIVVDTNVIVRFLTRDDESQFEASYRLFSTEDIFIPDTVILETEWVLRYAYEFTSEDICTAFEKLFGVKNVHLTDAVLISQVLEWRRQGMDFSDAMHLAHSQQYDKMYTFDKKFVSKAAKSGKCEVLLV